MNSGKKLAEEAEALFEWYGRWMCEYPQNIQNLSLLIFLSRISSKGGNFITEDQEIRATSRLHLLQEDLLSAKKKHIQFGLEIHCIIDEIAEMSPKAKLVIQSKKLEGAIQNHLKAEEGFIEKSKCIFNTVLAQITPQLPDINALAIAKEFAQIVAKIKNGLLNPKELLHQIENAMNSWMPLAAD